MKVIRDEELGGLGMIPLFCDWGIRRCNIKGCTEKPTTIVIGLHPSAQRIGMCEAHYQEAASTGVFKSTIEFDSFDAFAESDKAST